MSYSKRIVCLADSYKPPRGRCVAGIELLEDGLHGGWIRPVSNRPTAELSTNDYRYQDGTSPKLLDIIDIPLLESAPRGHQTENHVIDARYFWQKSGTLPWDELKTLKDRPPSLWPNVGHTSAGLYDCVDAAEAAKLTGSLLLVRTDDFVLEVGTNYFTGKQAFRGKFSYKGTNHNFSVTDPAARTAFGSKGQGDYPIGKTYLCLSLTEPFDKDGRCHKLVAGILSDPPL
jgi:hypothetical protein